MSPTRANDVAPPRVRKREMVFLSWDLAIELAEAHTERFRPMIYLAVDGGHAVERLDRPAAQRGRPPQPHGQVTEQLVRLDRGEWLRKEPKTPASIRSITTSAVHRRKRLLHSRNARSRLTLSGRTTMQPARITSW